MNTKGQGISINVVIIAVLALIVLVVLAVIFTGRIAIFDRGVSAAGKAELISMKVQYGDCRPTQAQEESFTGQFDRADATAAKEAAKDMFRAEISRCVLLSDSRGNCESGGCKWG